MGFAEGRVAWETSLKAAMQLVATGDAERRGSTSTRRHPHSHGVPRSFLPATKPATQLLIGWSVVLWFANIDAKEAQQVIKTAVRRHLKVHLAARRFRLMRSMYLPLD